MHTYGIGSFINNNNFDSSYSGQPNTPEQDQNKPLEPFRTENPIFSDAPKTPPRTQNGPTEPSNIKIKHRQAKQTGSRRKFNPITNNINNQRRRQQQENLTNLFRQLEI